MNSSSPRSVQLGCVSHIRTGPSTCQLPQSYDTNVECAPGADALSKQHDISRQLIRVWVQKYEAGALDEDAPAADLLQGYEAKIAALERMVGRQALEIEYRADRGDANPFIDRARPWREGHRGVALVALLRHERGATRPHGSGPFGTFFAHA